MTTINPAYELLGRLNNEPWLLSPSFTGVPGAIRAMLENRVTTDNVLLDASLRFGGAVPQEARPYAMVGQVAVIPVQGTLLNRFNAAWGFATGYDYIRSAYNAALADPAVKGIAFDVNSPGGDAQGCFEACEVIRAGRSIKPSVAIVNANAMSGAYAIASAAGSIVATPSSRVGSIGVVTMHVDYSKALNDDGVKVTFIYAGDHKVDGNPYEPLPKAVKDAIQDRVDSLYASFTSQVAGNRGIDEKKVRKTEAAVYDSAQALENGLIDQIEDASAAFAAFVQKLSPQNRESMQMTDKTETTETVQAPVDTTPEAAAPVVAAAPDSATVASVERERIAAILGCDEAQGRASLAQHLALKTSTSLEDARATLAASALEVAPKSESPFQAAMDSDQHPEVGAGAAAVDEPAPTSAAAIIRDYRAATGYQAKTVQ